MSMNWLTAWFSPSRSTVRAQRGNGAAAARSGKATSRPSHKRPWLAAYGQRIPADINADAYSSTLDMLEQAMKRFADKPAFRCFGQTLTYADTDRLSRDF